MVFPYYFAVVGGERTGTSTTRQEKRSREVSRIPNRESYGDRCTILG